LGAHLQGGGVMVRLYYERGPVRIWHGNCLEWLPTLEAGSVDADI
jgi:hypothetical protein